MIPNDDLPDNILINEPLLIYDDYTTEDVALAYINSLGITQDDIDYVNDLYKVESLYKCAKVPENKPHPNPDGLYVSISTRESEFTYNDAIKNRLQSPDDVDIIVWNEENYKFYHFREPDELLSYILALPPDKRTYHERIYESQPQKLRLDLDYKYGVGDNISTPFTDEHLDVIYESMTMALAMIFGAVLFENNQQIHMCDSSGDYDDNGVTRKKFSYHIIIGGFYTRSTEAAKKFAEMVKDLLIKQNQPELAKAIDLQIYGKAKGLRLPYNHRLKSNRIKVIPVGVEFQQTLITDVTGCKELFINGQSGAADYKPNHNLDIIIDDANIKSVIDAINNHNPTILDGLEFRGSRGKYLNFRRMRPSQCIFCNEVHHKDNTIYAIVNNGMVSIKCHHSHENPITIPVFIDIEIPKLDNNKLNLMDQRKKGESRIQYLCKRARAINQKDKLVKYYNLGIPVHRYSVDKLNDHGDKMEEYPTNVDTIFVKAHMGTGKTRALARLIGNLDKISRNSVLAASFRVSFAEMIALDLDLKMYQEINGMIDVINNPRVVVQMESFYKLIAKAYDILVLDEIESILNQCFSTTHQRPRASWNMLEFMIKNCKKVVCMDANITTDTIRLINRMRQNKSSMMIINETLPELSRHYITTIRSAAIAKLTGYLRDNKRVVVPTSSVDIAKKIKALIAKDFPTKKIKIYTGQNKKEHDDIDERGNKIPIKIAWLEYDVLIYTPTILAALSFAEPHFDYCVCFWYDKSLDVYSCMQMMKRVRNIISGEYIHFIKCQVNNFPDTPQAVKEFVTSTHGNMYKYYHGDIPYPLDNNDKFIINDDDYHFQAWINHIASQNKSKNHFLKNMIEELVSIGGVPVSLNVASEELISLGKKINKKMNLIGKEILKNEYLEITNARDLTKEEYNRITELSDISNADNLAIKKYLIRKFYDLPYNHPLTVSWLNVYWDNSIRKSYINRNTLHTLIDGRLTFNDYAKIIVDITGSNPTVEKVIRMNDVDKHKYCREFLIMFKVIGAENNQAEGEVPINDKFKQVTITKQELTDCLENNYEKLRVDSKIVCDLFGSKSNAWDSKFSPNNIRKILDYINGKIGSFYGVKIVSDKKQGEDYKLEDVIDKHFKFSDEGRLIPKI